LVGEIDCAFLVASARFRGEAEDVGAVADVGVVAVVVEAVGLPEGTVLETVFSGLGLKLWRRAMAAPLLLLVLVAEVAVEFCDIGRFASSCCCRCCGCCCDTVLRCVAVVVVAEVLAVAVAVAAPVAGLVPLLLIPRCGNRNLLSCVCVFTVDDGVSRTELWRCGRSIDFLRFKALSFAAVEAGAFVAVRVTLELP